MLPLLLACGYAAQCKDNVTIHGHIDHQLADTINIRYVPVSVKYKPVDHKARLENGNFSISFEVPDGYTSLTIINGMEGTELFVRPGTDLTLTLDAKNFDSTLHYEGAGKEIANYCAKCIVEKHSISEIDLKAQKLGTKELMEYRTSLTELINSEQDYVQKNGKDLPQDFKDYLLKAHQYEIYYTMHMYPMRQAMLKEKSMNNIKKEHYEVINDIPALFNDDYLTMPSYRAYLNNFYAMQVSAENARNGFTMEGDEWMDSVLARCYRNMPSRTAEYITGDRICGDISKGSIALAERRLVWYREHFPGSKFIPVLEEELEKRRFIGPGKPEIDFEITTPDGQKMKLSDLKGKVVYIDFWARHCAPCIGEMAAAKEVRDHFKNKPVAFVYVSVDEDDAVWRKSIKEFDIAGINTRLEKGKQSDLVDKYEAGAIPAHYLINKEGRFAKVDYVQRPKEKEALIAQIEKLLQ